MKLVINLNQLYDGLGDIKLKCLKDTMGKVSLDKIDIAPFVGAAVMHHAEALKYLAVDPANEAMNPLDITKSILDRVDIGRKLKHA